MADFETIPNGTEVTWHYRGAIGHGTIAGVHKMGTTAANTEYSINEHDHHVSSTGSREKSTVQHYGSALTRVSKSAPAQRYVLGIAYQAGYDPSIKKGADGFTDYVDPDDLELAAWGFMKGHPVIGLSHADGTVGHADVVESYIFRGPDWEQPDGTVVKAGDWLLAAVVDEPTWERIEKGEFTGWSPEGTATRSRIRRSTP